MCDNHRSKAQACSPALRPACGGGSAEVIPTACNYLGGSGRPVLPVSSLCFVLSFLTRSDLQIVIPDWSQVRTQHTEETYSISRA